MPQSQSEIARSIAEKAHEGQTDRAGVPYIKHPAHVADAVSGDERKAVAWLHDVVEDTAYTFDDLKDLGVNDTVIDALRLLTYDKSEPYMDYIHRIKGNQIARDVKLADLAHNSDLSRLRSVTESDRERVRKYRTAIDILSEQAS